MRWLAVGTVVSAGWLASGHAGAILVTSEGNLVITTPEIKLRLAAADAPRVSITRSVSDLYATVQPAGKVKGDPLYLDVADCPETGWLGNAHVAWTRAQGSTLVSGHSEQCSPPTRWFLVVGWLNHPVATADYTAAPGTIS